MNNITRMTTSMIRFLTPNCGPEPLALFRILLAAVLLISGFAMQSKFEDLCGPLALINTEISDVASGLTPVSPGDVAYFGESLGVGPAQTFRLVFAAYLAGLTGLLFGVQTRGMAVLAWAAHFVFKQGASGAVYGVDEFAHIGLTFCVAFPVSGAWSIDSFRAGKRADPTMTAGLGLRMIQLFLCVMYTTSGIEKAMGIQWWNGDAIWRALMRRDLGQFDFSFLASVPWIAMVAGWGTLALEVLYPVMIWHPWTRRVWLPGVVGMHIGIGVCLGLWSFAAVMILFNLCAFGFSIPTTAGNEK